MVTYGRSLNLIPLKSFSDVVSSGNIWNSSCTASVSASKFSSILSLPSINFPLKSEGEGPLVLPKLHKTYVNCFVFSKTSTRIQSDSGCYW
jgi:hypothetical protein